MLRQIDNSKAVLSAPPSFLAALASTGLFRMKRIYGDVYKTVVEIEFRSNAKMPSDWVFNLPLYEQ